jgi:hypothetical protein
MQAAREISKQLGHQEVICPLHLLLGLLINVRPQSLPFGQPSWSVVQEAMAEYAPPWADAVILSPGGQTPTTKQVLVRAIELAAEAGKPVAVEHVWSALQEQQPQLVAAVMARLAAGVPQAGRASKEKWR